MTITDIQTITIPVEDQERALTFYRDVLRFDVRSDNVFGANRWITVAPAGAATEMVLHVPFPGMTPGSSTGVVLSSDDIESTCAALREAGTIVNGPETVQWGRQAQFSDPDGNAFVLVQREV